MFGRKKKTSPSPPEAAASDESIEESKRRGGKKKGESKALLPAADPTPQVKKRRKFFSKRLIFPLLVIVAVGVAASVVYRIYFTKKSVDRVYVKQELPNIILAEEVIRFTYDLMPEFYNSIILFNGEMILMENEIKRLTALGEQFPDQVKISEKEMKTFEKEKNKLQQTYEKLEKRVEALYVSYRVNQESGIQQIQEQKNDITQSVNDAMAPVLELTKRLTPTEEKIPAGLVKGTIYKIKKKLNTLIK